MKKSNCLVFLSLCSLIFFTSCRFTINTRGDGSDHFVKASGVVVKKDIAVSDYRSIDVSNGIELILTDGERNSVFVEIDKEYEEYLDIHVSGKVLNIGIKNMSYDGGLNTIRVFASGRGVSDFCISSASSVIAKTKLVGNELTFDISSAGKFVGEVACKKITADMSSASNMEIAGTTDVFSMNISSASSVNAGKLRAKKVVCDASSASSATVYASTELNVDASSVSHVRYSGDAKIINIETSSASRVSKQ